MPKTTITVNESQKQSLIEFRSLIEHERGEDVSQGEAVSIAADYGKEHLRECNTDE